MATIILGQPSRSPIFRTSNRRQLPRPRRFVSPVVMRDDSRIAPDDQKKKRSQEILIKSNGRSDPPPSVAYKPNSSDLRFTRLQPSDDEIDCRHKRAFGWYVAREAVLDEEIWTAAWLRAESQWEGKPGTRYMDTFKRQFAEQEFNAIKRRCTRHQLAEKSTCIITVRKPEANVKHTVLKSVVGTLDINIRHLLSGETFPGVPMKNSASCSIVGIYEQPVYGYVANLSVAKFARRRGIASNMLLLAVEVAKSYGANEVFVHVYKDNAGARDLYEKLGFQMVEEAMSQSLKEQKYLLSLKTDCINHPAQH